jgi:hypothetical protein
MSYFLSIAEPKLRQSLCHRMCCYIDIFNETAECIHESAMLDGLSVCKTPARQYVSGPRKTSLRPRRLLHASAAQIQYSFGI